MGKRKKILLIMTIMMIPAAIFIFNSCYTDYGLTIADYDTVFTAYDQDANFQNPSYQTYWLEDEIIYLDDPDNSSSNQPANATLIKNTMDNQMALYGYTKETVDKDNAGVQVVAMYSETDYYYYWYDYWYWYSWGWYYPPGWGGGYTYAYTAGSLYIQMNDLNNPNPDDPSEYAALWFAAVNGILNDTSGGLTQRIVDTITQAFTQSPYLDRN